MNVRSYCPEYYLFLDTKITQTLTNIGVLLKGVLIDFMHIILYMQKSLACTLDTMCAIYQALTTKSYMSLNQEFQKLFSSSISYWTFINLKPFYISRPTKKETEMCLCSKCLNSVCIKLSNHLLIVTLDLFQNTCAKVLNIIKNLKVIFTVQNASLVNVGITAK